MLYGWMFNSSPQYCHKGLKFKICQFREEIQIRISSKKFFDDSDELIFGHVIRIAHLQFPANFY